TPGREFLRDAAKNSPPVHPEIPAVHGFPPNPAAVATASALPSRKKEEDSGELSDAVATAAAVLGNHQSVQSELPALPCRAAEAPRARRAVDRRRVQPDRRDRADRQAGDGAVGRRAALPTRYLRHR